jgi:DNA invertase Pin-like site-specific DNA recombinase
MTFAYIRVSTEKQHLENQMNEVKNFAHSRGITIDKWVTETVSGKTDKGRRKLGRLLKSLKKNDILIVSEVSRLSRNLTEIMTIVGSCLEKGINVYSIKENYHFDDSINSKVLCFAFGLVAEIERNLISQRTKEALALRKASGVKLGRPTGTRPKKSILLQNINDIAYMLELGSSRKDICRKYGVSSETLRRFLAEMNISS